MGHHHRKQNSSELHHLLPLINSEYFYSIKYKKSNSTLLRLFLLFSVFSFISIFVAFVLVSSSYPVQLDQDQESCKDEAVTCSSILNNSICCDRTSFRTDICYMKGDVRADSATNTIFLVNSLNETIQQDEKIRPYPRKWEKNTMGTIDELRLRSTNEYSPCDVRHNVPGVFFSTGGYTGNVYHEFNDGIIPLYITSEKFNKKVVLVILEYHDWWITKFENILAKISDYPPIDFSTEKRTHCFPEAIVGLKIHNELAIDSSKMTNKKTILDFRNLLDEAYKPRIQSILQEEQEEHRKLNNPIQPKKPKLVILSRNWSRTIENESELVKLAEEIGFRVKVLKPKRTTELAKIYRALNSCDVMTGVHGAAMTHFLFMRPGSVFIQIVPLGTDWAAESYYGKPAMKLGLKYLKFTISPKESSLYREYKKDDPVLMDPESVNSKGWEVTKRIYLDGQNVRLDLRRFRKRLVMAYHYFSSKERLKREYGDNAVYIRMRSEVLD